MNVIKFFESEGFGLQIILTAAVVGAADAILKKFQNRVPGFIVKYLPLIIAAAGAFICRVFTNGDISEEILYEGLLSYSLGTVISVSVRKIFVGENVGDALFMLITGLIENVCDVKSETVSRIADILKDISDEETAKTRIVETMRTDVKDGVDIAELAAVAELILVAAKRFIKEK